MKWTIIHALPLFLHLCDSRTHQVDGYAPSDKKATVDIHGMVLELNDASQAANNATDDEGEHQEWLQELGRVSQSGIKVHLWKETSLLTEVLGNS